MFTPRVSHGIGFIAVSLSLLLLSAPVASAQTGSGPYRYYSVTKSGSQIPLVLDCVRVVVRDTTALDGESGVTTNLLARLATRGIPDTSVTPCGDSHSFVRLPDAVSQGGADAVEAFVQSLVSDNVNFFVSPVFYLEGTDGLFNVLYVPLPTISVTFDTENTNRATRQATMQSFLAEGIGGVNSTVSTETDSPAIPEVTATEYPNGPFRRTLSYYDLNDEEIPESNDPDRWLDDGIVTRSSQRNGFLLISLANSMMVAAGVQEMSMDAMATTEQYGDEVIDSQRKLPSEIFSNGTITPDMWGVGDLSPYSM